MSGSMVLAIPPVAQQILASLTMLAGVVATLSEIDPTLFGAEGSIENSQVGQACLAAGSLQIAANVAAASTALIATVKPVVPSVIPAVIAAVDGLSLMFGFGTPYEAHDIRVSSRSLNSIYELSNGASPGDGWQGLASQAYADRNSDERQCAKDIYGIDGDLVYLIKSQAGFVTVTRMVLGTINSLLSLAYCYEVYLKDLYWKLDDMEGLEAVEHFAFGCASNGAICASLMLVAASGAAGAFGAMAARNAFSDNNLENRYEDAASELGPTPTPTAFTANMSSTPTADFGWDIHDRLISPSEDDAIEANMRGGAPREKPLTQAAAMPSWTQVMQRPGRAARPVGYAAPHGNGVNHTTGRLAPIAPSAQPDREAATPDEASLAGTAPVEAAYAYATSHSYFPVSDIQI